MKTYYPMGEFKGIKKGDRFITLVDNAFIDKTFPAGSKVTFLGFTVRRSYDYRAYGEDPVTHKKCPKFKFDRNSYKRRMLREDELKALTNQ